MNTLRARTIISGLCRIKISFALLTTRQAEIFTYVYEKVISRYLPFANINLFDTRVYIFISTLITFLWKRIFQYIFNFYEFFFKIKIFLRGKKNSMNII